MVSTIVLKHSGVSKRGVTSRNRTPVCGQSTTVLTWDFSSARVMNRFLEFLRVFRIKSRSIGSGQILHRVYFFGSSGNERGLPLGRPQKMYLLEFELVAVRIGAQLSSDHFHGLTFVLLPTNRVGVIPVFDFFIFIQFSA